MLSASGTLAHVGACTQVEGNYLLLGEEEQRWVPLLICLGGV